MPSGDRLLLKGTRCPDQWNVYTWRQNGVTERSARQVIAWEEVAELPPQILDTLGNPVEPEPLTDAELEEKRRSTLLSNARRAKTMCRRVIITEGFDELLTLTYRENQGDRALCKVHFNLWLRRMKLALGHDETYVDRQGKTRTKRVPGNFRFCASFERQDRGAMHVHIATHRLPPECNYKGVKLKTWKLGTMVWRDIVGADNGLCFVGGRTRWGTSRRNKMRLAKMAAYVSKYILKDFEDAPLESNRYSRSNGVQIGEVHKMELTCSFRDLIELTFEQGDGDVVIAHRVSKWKDGLWLCTESSHLGSLLSSA